MRPTTRPFSSPVRNAVSLPEVGALRSFAHIRWGLLLAALALAGIGLATVHSATAELASDFLAQHALRVVLGVGLMLVVFAIDYQVLAGLSLPIYVAGCAGLALVLLAGQEAGGARSWLGTEALRFQPSEFVKLATVLLLARTLAQADQRYLDLRQTARAAALVLVPMALIVLERDLGGAAMFAPMLLGMMLVAGVRWRYLLAGALLVALLGGLAWNFALLDYQRQRIVTFLSPETDPLGAGYQLRQSKIAVGSGELTGRGYMQGTQSQLRFLPARHTDFIFAVLAEEWGFVGVAVALALYGVYIWNGFRVAQRARDRLGVLLVVGLLSVFSVHVLYNTAMVVGLVPITGIPLPFLSYGGSFALTNFVATGLILGVDLRRHANR